MTNNVSCCNGSDVGGWRDEGGSVVQEVDRDTCLYVTREYKEINLNRKLGCTDHTSGLWRCDIPDFSGEMQSLYIYISNDRSVHGKIIYTSLLNIYVITEIQDS